MTVDLPLLSIHSRNMSIPRTSSDSETHRIVKPAILYMGTPVVLVSTQNEDGTFNLAPISSAFWLGDRCVLGIISTSQTTINLIRTGQCVLNLPSDDMVSHVNAISRTTGAEVVPLLKQSLGYRYLPDKFGAAGLKPQPSGLVAPPRASKCPVQMEAELISQHGLMDDHALKKGSVVALEVRILRVHALKDILSSDHANRIDPDKWRPLIMSFQRFYGLSNELQPSILAQIDEEKYRVLAQHEMNNVA